MGTLRNGKMSGAETAGKGLDALFCEERTTAAHLGGLEEQDKAQWGEVPGRGRQLREQEGRPVEP